MVWVPCMVLKRQLLFSIGCRFCGMVTLQFDYLLGLVVVKLLPDGSTVLVRTVRRDSLQHPFPFLKVFLVLLWSAGIGVTTHRCAHRSSQPYRSCLRFQLCPTAAT